MAALEIHAPMARSDIETPTMVVFDLDLGEPATIVECADVALDIRHVLEGVDLVGSRRRRAPRACRSTCRSTPGRHPRAGQQLRQAVAQVLERARPADVVSNMNKKLRTGKVFVDWSQNSRHKTTIAPYSCGPGPDRPSPPP